MTKCDTRKCKNAGARIARVFGKNGSKLYQDAKLCGVCVAKLRLQGYTVTSGIVANAHS